MIIKHGTIIVTTDNIYVTTFEFKGENLKSCMIEALNFAIVKLQLEKERIKLCI